MHMSTKKLSKTDALVVSAFAAVLALGASTLAKADTASDPQEKCFGVAKASANDCQTASNSCAGSATINGQADAWIYVPKGLCERLNGGSLTPKAS
jgi:uncharacterized membrane protein